MGNNKKGRPPKPPKKRKRYQVSVWMSAEEKQEINKLVEVSNLSASQFFLSQVLDKPIKRPKKKTLPKAIIDQMATLEKLSGLLALSALKTKDKVMIAENWQKSSQDVKWITRLITLWIFSEFDLPNFKRTLKEIQEKSKLLYWQLEPLLKGNNSETLDLVSQINRKGNEVSEAFDKQYQMPNSPQRFQEFWNEGFDIHQEIENLKKKLLTT